MTNIWVYTVCPDLSIQIQRIIILSAWPISIKDMWPDQTASSVWSGSTVLAILSAYFRLITVCSNFRLLRMRRWFFAYHHTVNHPHKHIILSWFSIALVLKCAAKIFENRFTNKNLTSKNVFELGFLHGEIVSKGSHYFPEKNSKF